MGRCRPKILEANLNVKLADDSYTHVDKKAEVRLRPKNAAPSEPYQTAQFYIQNGNADIFGYQALVGLNVVRLFNLHISTKDCIVHVYYNGRSIGRQMPVPSDFRGSISVDNRFDKMDQSDPELQGILRKYKEAFTDLGPLPVKGKPMRILTTHQRPIFAKQRHYSPEEIVNMKPIIEDLRKKGFIEPATSGYAANSKLVKKKNGTWRMVINYIPLNAVTLRDSYALPQIQDIFGVIQSKEYFSTLDCTNGFYQILVDPRDKHKTGFSSPFGNFQFKRCPFGARNSCAAFQAQMNEVFAEGLYTKCAVYVDDILVFGQDKAEHDRNLAWVLAKCTEFNVKIKLDKCCFRQKEVRYLGFLVSGKCIRPLQDKVDAISQGRPPRDKTELRSIVGKLNFYARFIPNYSRELEPIRELFRQNREFSWKPYHQEALNRMINALNSKPVHVLEPRSSHKIIELHIMTDSLEVLCLNTSEELICRASRFLSVAESNYSIIEKQLLALVLALNKFQLWLDPDALTVRVSSKDLQKVFQLTNRSDRVERLLLSLPVGFDSFKFEVKPSLTTTQKDKINAHLPEEVYYIDGSCRNNGKPNCEATWAVCAEFDRELELTGHVTESPSNQSAELTAAVKACEHAKQSGYQSITIVTDSRYLHSAMTTWIDTWKNNNWLDHKRKPVINRSLFEQLIYAKEGLSIEWIHVKGHADSEGNNRADLLARSLLDQQAAILCAARPTASRLQKSNPEIDELIKQIESGQTNDFVIEDGVVFYIDRKRDQSECKRIYVPEGSRYYLLNIAHDNPAYGGHLGIKKTYRKLSRFWWPHMHRQIEEYVTCDSCQRYKEPKGLPPGYMHNIPVSRVFQHLHLDMIGPVGATQQGNAYIITATDAYTKWAIARPVKNIKTSEVLRFLNDYVLAIHGAPEVIITDRGSQFTSKEWKDVMDECKLKHNLTCAYHPQANGIDERVNGTIVRILRHYVDKYHSDWDEKVRWAVYLYNTTVHESTGFSPYQLLYGLDPRSPLREGQSQADNMQNVQQTREEIRRKANELLKLAQATQKAYYDRNHRQFELKVGDLVLTREHTVPTELNKKFYAKWDGPEVIVGFIGEPDNPKAVKVLDLTTLARRNVAINHVKPYSVREGNSPPVQQKEKGGVQIPVTEHCDASDFIDLDDCRPSSTDDIDKRRETYSKDLSEIELDQSYHPLSSSRRVTFAEGVPDTLIFEAEPVDECDGIHDITQTEQSQHLQQETAHSNDATDSSETILVDLTSDTAADSSANESDRSKSIDNIDQTVARDIDEPPDTSTDVSRPSPYAMEFIQDDSIKDPNYCPSPEHTRTREDTIDAPRKARSAISRLPSSRISHSYNLRPRSGSAYKSPVSSDVTSSSKSSTTPDDKRADESIESQNTTTNEAISEQTEKTDDDETLIQI
jgi:ribonuclease HI